MPTTLLTLDGRARRLGSIALLGTAILAACDSDQPVAPKATEVPAAATPSLLKANTGSVVIKLVDGANAIIPLTGAGFTVEGPGQTKWTIMDAGPNDQKYDSDSTAGVILIKNMTAGQYKFCEGLPPNGYGVVNPRCQTTGVYVGATSGLVFHHLPVAHVKWSVTDFASNLIGGAVFTLDSNNVTIAAIGDNTVLDSDPTPGKFDVKLPFESYYKICVTTPPAGYVFPVNQITCAANTIKQGTTTNFGQFYVNPVYSAFWKVTDGSLDANSQYTLIGPSSFKLASADGLYNFDVVDNSINDFDAALGKIAVKLTEGGYWSLCETQPPVNHWNAQPSCKRISVASGEPASADYFINYEKQVYNPGPAPIR
jgi:hypothetical protein